VCGHLKFLPGLFTAANPDRRLFTTGVVYRGAAGVGFVECIAHETSPFHEQNERCFTNMPVVTCGQPIEIYYLTGLDRQKIS
jgi:hypothetical protein